MDKQEPVSTPAIADLVERYNAGLASQLLPKLLWASIIHIRSQAWSGNSDPARFAAMADAIHNMPAFLLPERADAFDHHRFLEVEARSVLASSHDLEMAGRWRHLLQEAYGAQVVELVEHPGRPRATGASSPGPAS